MHTQEQRFLHEIAMPNLPFPVRRVYWVYQVPTLTERGTHAHRLCHEYIVLLKGRLHVNVMELTGHQHEHILSKRGEGLYLPPWVWKAICYSDDAVLIVLASEDYDAAIMYIKMNLTDCV